MKFTGLVLAALLLLVGYVASPFAESPSEPEVRRVVFTSDGNIQIPVGYREWYHVGTRYKSSGTNLLDGTTLTAPQVMNAYVEPSALKVFQSTGKWPDGTQIVKEFSEIRQGKDCDAKTYICTTPLGSGIFETGYSGLAMMVKDKQHFPNEPGNWAYFGFGHQAPPYQKTARAFPRERCASCHIKNAADTGYVFTRAHIALTNGQR